MILQPCKFHLRCKRRAVGGDDPSGTCHQFLELLGAVVAFQIRDVSKGWLQVDLMAPKALAWFARRGKSRRRRVFQMSFEVVETESQLPVFHHIESFDFRLLKRVSLQRTGSLEGHKDHGVDVPTLPDFYQAIAVSHPGLDNGHLPGRQSVLGAKLRVGGADSRERIVLVGTAQTEKDESADVNATHNAIFVTGLKNMQQQLPGRLRAFHDSRRTQVQAHYRS